MYRNVYLMRFLSLVFTSLLVFTTSAAYAGWIKFSLPDPRDVIPELDGLLDGDICAATPGCSAVDYNVRSCIISFDENACATSILLPNFIDDCKKTGGLVSTIYENLVEQKLTDVVELHGLYGDVVEIFEVRLKSPGFAQFVRDNVDHYVVSRGFLSGEGKTSRTTIYYDNYNPPAELVMHELVHVWQYYKYGMTTLSESYCEETAENGALPTYRFTLDSNKSFYEYGREQQGEIIEEFYRIVLAGELLFCDSEDNFLNCASYSNVNDMKDDFVAVIGNTPVEMVSWLIPVLSLLN
ncbi:hypothetical protein [Teredinibacter sp. KSP-S5-2]|uniref:hypothetical protein n=1 Tax=Teredinibacter sp. KSP-S5-2 TaxID=3034506 RepID=UPI0029348375|nr:hypothetical protein [Teredinibacter sp. KSP-S5-2]WNO07668.1 hypothetical protein P5V12_11770 [Teredinibacter sp. KSP-S5-2]